MPGPGRRTSLAAVAVVLGCVPLAACDGGGSGPGGPGRSTFVEALAELPRLDDTILITWSDLDAVREANGYDEVPDLDDDDARNDYVGRMFDGDDASVVPASVPLLESARPFEEGGPRYGWLGAEAVASVLADGRELAWYSGVDDFSADEGLSLASEGDEAVLSADDALVDAWREGSGDTLADDEEVVAVAAALDEADSVSGIISRLSGDGGFDLVGVGWRDDDGDPAFTLVYAFGSAEDADDAREEVEDGFAELTDDVTVEEVRADGPLVVVVGHQVDRLLAPYELLPTFRLPLMR